MLKYRKIYFIFSSALVAISIASLLLFGLNLGIDFTGGTLMEVKVITPPYEGGDWGGDFITTKQIEEILEKTDKIKLGDVRVQPTETSFIIRMRDITEDERQIVLDILQEKEGGKREVAQERFESIGGTVGYELKQKAIWQIFLVSVGILLYIAWAFKKVSHLKEKSKISWKFSITAFIALIHDCTITLGVFAILGKFLDVEIDSSFIAAILLVLGYSVNDTIVVFDRIRENMIKHKILFNLEKTINESVKETAVRSINTSSTTLIVLFAILFFGGPSTFYFVLALIIGIGIGTYSSIFLASPLLFEWERK